MLIHPVTVYPFLSSLNRMPVLTLSFYHFSMEAMTLRQSTSLQWFFVNYIFQTSLCFLWCCLSQMAETLCRNSLNYFTITTLFFLKLCFGMVPQTHTVKNITPLAWRYYRLWFWPVFYHCFLLSVWTQPLSPVYIVCSWECVLYST